MEEWFKLKKYPHIGMPLTINDYPWVKEYILNETNIKGHSFLPLIYKCILKRKYRTNKDKIEKNPSGKKKRVVSKPKIRHTYFSSHIDSLIFSYYNQLICKSYEKYISDKNFNNSIVGYRKLPVDGLKKGNKCNIDFAKSVFNFIQSHNTLKLSVIVADVTSFFDNLDHKILKRQWAAVLDKKALPPDHYNLFKALTRITYLQSEQLFKSYNNTMIVRKGVPNSSTKTEYQRVPIRDVKYLKEKAAVAYCTKSEFLKNSLPLVISKENDVGIPQGNPLSSTLANVYMLEFDRQVYDKLESVGGFYQRYSDDLIVVCDQQYEDDVITFLRDKIQNLVHLEISAEKTKVYRFQAIGNKFRGFLIDETTKTPHQNKVLEYLGFLFDGEKVLIKPSGFAKYYRSMKRSFKRSTSLALYGKNPDKRIFKSKLYKKFTHVGAGRKAIYKPTSDDKTKFVKTNRYDWGNYISYVHKANSVMQSINASSAIRRQSRRFWRKFHLLMKYYQNRVNSAKQAQL